MKKVILIVLFFSCSIFASETHLKPENIKDHKKSSFISEIWEPFVNESFSDTLFWLTSPEYKNAQVLVGIDEINSFFLEKIRERKAKIIIFGEHHDEFITKEIFINMIKIIPDISLLVQETLVDKTYAKEISINIDEDKVTHRSVPQKKITYFGILTDLGRSITTVNGVPYDGAYAEKAIAAERSINDIIKSRGISVGLLHFPFEPERETKDKILTPLVKSKGVAVVYTGAAHSMQDIREKRPAELGGTYFDELKKSSISENSILGINAKNVKSSVALLTGELIRKLIEELLSDPPIDFNVQIFSTIEASIKPYVELLASRSFDKPQLIWLDKFNRGLLIPSILPPEPKIEEDLMMSVDMVPIMFYFLSLYPEIRELIKSYSECRISPFPLEIIFTNNSDKAVKIKIFNLGYAVELFLEKIKQLEDGVWFFEEIRHFSVKKSSKGFEFREKSYK